MKHVGWHWREFLPLLALAEVQRLLAVSDAFGILIIESSSLFPKSVRVRFFRAGSAASVNSR